MPPKATSKQQGAKTSKSTPLGRSSGNSVRKPATNKSSSTNKSSHSNMKKAAAIEAELGSRETAETTSPAELEETVNYLFWCRLNGTENPTINRLLSVPSTLKFEQFHHVLQIAFGWRGCHMYAFSVDKLPEANQSPDPFPQNLFQIAEKSWESTMDEASDKDAADVSLADIFEGKEYKEKIQVTYEYDMGDSWTHDIVFLGRESPGVRKVMTVPDIFPILCLGGEGHPCVEDCGGFDGFERLKDILTKPRARDPDSLREWYKETTGDLKPFNAYQWDIFEVNDELRKFAESCDFA